MGNKMKNGVFILIGIVLLIFYIFSLIVIGVGNYSLEFQFILSAISTFFYGILNFIFFMLYKLVD
jgi:hypothetical protein